MKTSIIVAALLLHVPSAFAFETCSFLACGNYADASGKVLSVTTTTTDLAMNIMDISDGSQGERLICSSARGAYEIQVCRGQSFGRPIVRITGASSFDYFANENASPLKFTMQGR